MVAGRAVAIHQGRDIGVERDRAGSGSAAPPAGSATTPPPPPPPEPTGSDSGSGSAKPADPDAPFDFEKLSYDEKRAFMKEKVVPTMKVRAPDRIKRGAKAKVKVTLRAADGVPVTGQVRVAIKGGQTITASLDGGKAVVRLPKATKGKLKLTITYLGSDLAEQVVDKVTIKVRR